MKSQSASPEDAKFDKDMFSPGAPATNTQAERQRTLILSVAQELYSEAHLQLLTGDQAGFAKKLEQSKAVWRASEKFSDAAMAK